ncbi:MAG: aminomethyltransferase family protein [Acidobacteriota bacterium]|nr:aminomethyltransferase family protein [Acidobacteriota bacterium]
MRVSADEYRAARDHAGLFDRSARGRIVVTGADAAAFLHGVLTNDITVLAPGQGCYALYLTPQGRLIADLDVLRLENGVLLGVHLDVTGALMARFDQSIFAEDVCLEDVTAGTAQWHVCGPAAGEIAAAATGSRAATLAALPEYGHVSTTFGGRDARIVATRPTGLRGFDVIVDAADSRAVHQALLDAGAAELAPETVETLRVEAGVPAFHVDMDETTIPLEAGLEQRAISFTKGCYVGQEVIVRVMHRGHGRVARHLMGLTLEGTDVPAVGDQLRAGDKDVGRITSAVFSPAFDRPIALAYLQRDWLTPGTAVQVIHGPASWPAVVAALPFTTGTAPAA